jgi:hypothetical protein
MGGKVHCPDVSTLDGLVDYLSLLNVIRLGLVLWPESYGIDCDTLRPTSPFDPRDYKAAEMIGASFCLWLDQHIMVTSENDPTVSTTVTELANYFLVDQYRSLLAMLGLQRDTERKQKSAACNPQITEKMMQGLFNLQFQDCKQVLSIWEEVKGDPAPNSLAFARKSPSGSNWLVSVKGTSPIHLLLYY